MIWPLIRLPRHSLVSRLNTSPSHLGCIRLEGGVLDNGLNNSQGQSIMLMTQSWLGALMGLPIRYLPMASYFWLSIIFLTPQILWHLLRRHDLFWLLCNHHRLYPIPIAPLAWYHIGDLPYDLWTTLLFFTFFVYLMCPVVAQPITSHCTMWSGPYHMCHHTRTLCSFYLSFVFKTFVSTPKKKGSFPPEFRPKFVSSHRFASLRLRTFTPSHLRTFVPSHTSETLRHIAPSQTSVSHHFALLDTTSGDHFTAPELHPSEPHRIYT